ncbi:MAG: bifunctional folylpolyglutamate synthase/dihydrofolate synthase [Pirellulales bacterium]|nr:bifunctional folylpolyglutamate synthase/dihydrofolate synthase [Pirellulales bacterium]
MAHPNKDITNLPRPTAREFLDRRVDFERFSRIPDPARAFRLDRMRNLLAKLGNPQNSLPIIHVAGTKGKGSTSAMLAAVLSNAGYRTGLFTSPHLEKVEERIVLDGRQCSESEFDALIEAVQPIVEELDNEAAGGHFEEIGPTYFEILTAMAMLYFRRQNATAVVLEVGLGGRLDSTNACLPRVSVITSISFDHTLQLGSTLQAIAREKGGIIKPGIPVVSGVVEEEPRVEIRRIAREAGARLIEAETDFHYEYSPPEHLERGPQMGNLEFKPFSPIPLGEGASKVKADDHRYELSLLGRHQAGNAAVALATIFELRRQGWAISETALRRGLVAVSLPARVEVIARRPAVILDSAHNIASIAALVAAIGESFAVRKRHLIFAATKEKDNRGMLELLFEAFDEVYLTRYTSNPRFVPQEELAAIAYEFKGKRYPTFSSSAEAWEFATKNAAAEDLICITGSFFLAGEMRRYLTRPAF